MDCVEEIGAGPELETSGERPQEAKFREVLFQWRLQPICFTISEAYSTYYSLSKENCSNLSLSIYIIAVLKPTKSLFTVGHK